MKILLTGGSGLLGRHLKIEVDRPTHAELDVTDPTKCYYGPYDLIIHGVAYTNVKNAELERWKCENVNVNGTRYLLGAYPSTPFVYISSEYANKPVNFYSVTKAMGEQLVKGHTAPYLIIRTLFKQRPWKYDKAFIDQYTQGDYVDVIAPMIEKAIIDWDRKTSKVIYIGTGRKTIYDLAKQTRDVEPISINSVEGVRLPADYE